MIGAEKEIEEKRHGLHPVFSFPLGVTLSTPRLPHLDADEVCLPYLKGVTWVPYLRISLACPFKVLNVERGVHFGVWWELMLWTWTPRVVCSFVSI